jgi:chemotaxis protein MotB|tara:strand:- start:711 stop:2561 length:1851 start_codon:yes stop_codon:yes gene_type:complete
MSTRSLRNRLADTTNIWPGFVDVLATLLIVIIFVLMVFTVSQIYLSDAISGRDKALQDLRSQINELSKILVIETKDKEEALSILSETEKELEDTQLNLQDEQLLSEQLQTDVAKKRSEIFVQEQNIIALSEQISSLLKELRIVANALETYEGQEIALLETEGLGERINKALATRIDQLKILNQELDNANFKLIESEKSLKATITELNEKNNNLIAINKSLGLEDGGIEEQLLAIKNKNEKLLSLNKELEKSNIELSLRDEELQSQNEKLLSLNDELEKTNIELSLRDEELQSQISQYQELMNDLLEINDSLGLKDASLNEQLEAIRFKNEELARLNKDLIQKDSTIFNLRSKISELNNVLSLSEDKQKQQLEKLELLQNQIVSLEEDNQEQKETSLEEIEKMEIQASKTLEQVEILSNQIDTLQKEIALLNSALEASEVQALIKDLEIEVLGEKLNKALTSKVFELQKYRSEFFGKLQSILGDRKDIKIVGDRFIFESELLFDSASADLQLSGKEKLSEIGLTLKETTNEIPTDIDWIIMVEGHTDKRPIQTIRYPSNWELSSARANTVLKLLLDLGFPPNRLASAGYGEFYPISDGENESDLQQNRRIELKLTSR